MFVECTGGLGVMSLSTSNIVDAAKPNVIKRPTWIPLTRPIEAISAPPAIGAITMGTRFRIDCSVKPIARRSRGKESPITAKIAGDAILCQAIANARPINRNGHEVLKR